MGRKRLSIKKSKKAKADGLTAIKKRPPSIRKRKKPRPCSYCKEWHRGPLVEREEGEPVVRLCKVVNKKRAMGEKIICRHWDDDWIVILDCRKEVIRDEFSPPKIKKRKKKIVEKKWPKFEVERRLV